ncbi:hypothetical protein TWF225_010552 [Orbilia oligospora]|nr:hypothetical protein TWF225_010552 [Orbilia oligospora]
MHDNAMPVQKQKVEKRRRYALKSGFANASCLEKAWKIACESHTSDGDDEKKTWMLMSSNQMTIYSMLVRETSGT